MDRDERKNANRLNELENIVENYTRTERHLEQHSDIGDPARLEHAKEIQKFREGEIKNIKEKIIYGEAANNSNEVDNLKKNFEFTKNYLEEYAKEMDDFTLEKTTEKQKHRDDQIKALEKNKNEQN